MRVALISDIHACDIALTAVLTDIKGANVDQVVCLGDVVNLGPNPDKAIEILKDLDCLYVMGNHDFHMLNPDTIDQLLLAIQSVTHWTLAQLSGDDLAFPATFSPRIEIPLAKNATMLCFHGSPQSNQDILLPTTSDEMVAEMLTDYEAPIMAGGHTHVQMFRQYKGMAMVNPGSVGEPFQTPHEFGKPPHLLPWAEYAIVTWQGESLHVDLRRIPYDLKGTQQAVLESKMPDTAYWVKFWGG